MNIFLITKQYNNLILLLNFKEIKFTFSTSVSVVVQFVAIATETLVEPVYIVANVGTTVFGAAFVNI